MSVTAIIAGLLPAFGSTDEDDGLQGLEGLRQLLKEREAELTLTATFGEPRPNMTDEPTVQFPYDLHTGEGVLYGTGMKEFSLPDNGLNDAESNLVQFLGNTVAADADSVDFESLAAVEGLTAEARVNENGDIEVAA